MHARLVLLLLASAAVPVSRAHAREIEIKPGEPLTAAAIGDAKRVILRGGTHRITEPLVLTPSNSGLTIEGFPGEQPILSGGRRIEGWRNERFNDRDVWA